MAINRIDDQSFTYTADVLAGPLFFGLIGYALDQWVFLTGHRWVIAGLVLGIVMGLYAAFIRYRRAVAAIEAAERARRQPSCEPGLQHATQAADTSGASISAKTSGISTTHCD